MGSCIVVTRHKQRWWDGSRRICQDKMFSFWAAFRQFVDVMDYSLLVGIDEEKPELHLGIIDFMRQYTWDKHLETWVKASGILGGPKNVSPTVISPKQYKKRFRKAMTTYFLMVPDQWSPPSMVRSKSQTDLCEDNNSQSGTCAAAD